MYTLLFHLTIVNKVLRHCHFGWFDSSKCEFTLGVKIFNDTNLKHSSDVDQETYMFSSHERYLSTKNIEQIRMSEIVEIKCKSK